MCEFKVKLIDKKEIRDVAEDVLFAQSTSGQILLKNVLGIPETVQDSIILEVSVPSERMTLISSPILGDLMKFLELQNECYKNGAYNDEIARVWDELKKKGNEFLKELQEELK
ncbi:MAG: CooT family nickel-binding protein [Candidatus Helarchaeota archaeon]